MYADTQHLTPATFCLLFLLAACGFHPMYGDEALGESGTALRGNIIIDSVGSGVGHESQMFKIALEDRFNPQSVSTANAQYRLAVSLRKQLVPAVVKSDGTIQRYDLRFDSDFKLFKIGARAPVLIGDLRRIGSYNAAVNANFATYEAEQDVIERCLQELAEDYVLRISGYLESQPEPGKPAS